MTDEELGAQSGPEVAEVETPLPPVELRETFQSRDKLVNGDRLNNLEGRRVKTATRFGEYVIAVLPGGQAVTLLDQSGQPVAEFQELGKAAVPINWRSLFREMGLRGEDWNTYICDSRTNPGVATPSRGYTANLPLYARRIAEAKMSASKSIRISLDSFRDPVYLLRDASALETIVEDDMVIICCPATGAYVAYGLHGKSGVAQPPRNWSIYPAADSPEPVLNEIQQKIERLLVPSENVYRVNQQYYFYVSDGKVMVLPYGTQPDGGQEVWFDKVSGIGKNVCIDPRNSNTVYYCQESNPNIMFRLRLEGDPQNWQIEQLQFPNKYPSISRINMTPDGNFFVFGSAEFKDGIHVISTDTLEEVGHFPDVVETEVDEHNRIWTVNKQGKLVSYELDGEKTKAAMEARRATRLARGINVDELFKAEQAVATEAVPVVPKETMAHLDRIKSESVVRFQPQIEAAKSLEDIGRLRRVAESLEGQLRSKGLRPAEVAYISGDIHEAIQSKERDLAIQQARVVIDRIKMQVQDAGAVTITRFSELSSDLKSLEPIRGLVDEATRLEIQTLETKIGEIGREVFKTQGTEIEKNVADLVVGARKTLSEMTSLVQFNDWYEFTYPQLVSRLGSLANNCPPEANEAQTKILEARRALLAMADEYKKKFEQEYAAVREKAAEVIEGRVQAMGDDIKSLLARVRERRFKTREEAEQYLRASSAKDMIESEIAEISKLNPTAAKELQKKLRVETSTLLSEIERQGMAQVEETGEQMVVFGSVRFPRFEGKVKQRSKKNITLSWDSQGRRTNAAGEAVSDIVLIVRNSEGHEETVRLWEDLGPREGVYQYGYESRHITSSVVTPDEFQAVMRDYRQWTESGVEYESGEQRERVSLLRRLGIRTSEQAAEPEGERTPPLKREWLEKQRAVKERCQRLKEFYERARVQLAAVETPEQETEAIQRIIEEKRQLIADRDVALQEYHQFYTEHHLALLRHIDRVREAPETTYANGRGFVPEWQSHWIVDQETEQHLEQMARYLLMQTHLHEGILNLKGHAGTGKDVLVKMFCNLANRPYFAMDCSKWTTEFELSEDVVLEAKDGATQTIKVPSVVLNAIQTPGAVMYFNEINAMPEQAQIFLHGLFDEKRSITLKTSSGKTISADPSVLFISSMNPGYPGTFDPQFATKSRMVSLTIGYPPETREPAEDDHNRNPMIDSSEALRVARMVDSLEGMTYEANLEHNQFVQLWNNYINGIETGASAPNSTQRFDLDVILALVQFANKLRHDFIIQFENRREARNVLPVKQPLTGREMRRCAYLLSQISPEAKTKLNPEQVARDLLEETFLSHIDSTEDREKIRTAMRGWTSSKRAAA